MTENTTQIPSNLLRVASEVRTAYLRLRASEAAPERATSSIPTITASVRVAPAC